MPTLVLDPAPPQLQQLLAHRRRLGLDRSDEVWDGVLHMNPAAHRRHGRILQLLAETLGPAARRSGLIPLVAEFNLGDAEDHRIPDGGLFRPGPDEAYCATAALVIEIVSPGDETWAKLPFYARHNVDELLIIDPQQRRVHWFALAGGHYSAIEQSALIALGPAALAARIDWP